jgi:DNA-binding NtrC family response regulator
MKMQENLAYKLNNDQEGFTSSYFFEDKTRQDLAYRIGKDVDDAIQIPVRDITDRFKQKLTEFVYEKNLEEDFPTRRQALDYFEREFFKRSIDRTKGNLAQLARESGRSRERLYPVLKKHDLMDFVDHKRPIRQRKLEERMDRAEYIHAENIESTLSDALSGYKNVIHPSLYDNIKESIKEKSPMLAQRISSYMPTQDRRLNDLMQTTEGINNYKEAKSLFEKQIVYEAFKAADGDVKKTARYLGDSEKTVRRKIKEFRIEEKAKEEKEEIPVAKSDVERLKQLVEEYESRREAARKEKERKKDESRMAA